jgi:pantoate--beta-alanine ligase
LTAFPARFTASSKVPSPTSTPFDIFRSVPPLRSYRRDLLLSQQPPRTLGLVPTMGALHQGHLSLIRLAAAENTDVAVSIYINPTQFAPHEDLASYPRTWNTDIQLLRELDAELSESKSNGRITAIFAPTTQVMYPTHPPPKDPTPPPLTPPPQPLGPSSICIRSPPSLRAPPALYSFVESPPSA